MTARNGKINLLLGLLLLTAALASPGAARAGFVISAPTFTASAGSSGTFEVTLKNDDASASPAVAAFSFQLGVSASSGIKFTDASTGTALNAYLFAGSSFVDSGPFPFSDLTSPSASFVASDLSLDPAGTTLAAGQTLGLGLVSYSIDTGASSGPVSLTILAAGTGLLDPSGGALDFTSVDGSITIIGGTDVATPAPASLALFAAGVPWLWIFLRARRKAITP